MIRGLLKLVLVVVLVVAAAAFFLGNRVAVNNDQKPIGTTGRAAPVVDTEKAREAGARIGETVATEAAQAQRALSNAGVTAKIKAKMALDETVRASAIDVDTTAGVVTLTGTVGSAAERTRAIQLARETEGVTSVSDRLVIQ